MLTEPILFIGTLLAFYVYIVVSFVIYCDLEENGSDTLRRLYRFCNLNTTFLMVSYSLIWPLVISYSIIRLVYNRIFERP